MKKHFMISLIVLILCIFTACNSTQTNSNPEAELTYVVVKLNDGKYAWICREPGQPQYVSFLHYFTHDAAEKAVKRHYEEMTAETYIIQEFPVDMGDGNETN